MYHLSRAHFVIPEVLHGHCLHDISHHAAYAPRLCACCMISAMSLSGCSEMTGAHNTSNDSYYHGISGQPIANKIGCIDDDFSAPSC